MLFKKKKKTEEQLARELAKKRERQRKKMIRTRYGQKQKKHAKKGLESCFCATISFFLLFMMLLNSYNKKGNIGASFGILAIVTLVLVIYGFIVGIHGFKERDKNYITCKIGVTATGLLGVMMISIFIRGLF